MFSRADYELASRMLGLPMPETPDEQAAAAPDRDWETDLF